MDTCSTRSNVAELQAHIPTCPFCQADLQLYQGLRAQASQRWPAATSPVALGQGSAQREAASPDWGGIRFTTAGGYLDWTCPAGAGFVPMDFHENKSCPGNPALQQSNPNFFNPRKHSCCDR